MRTSSAKAKGRRAAQEVKEAILEVAPFLAEDDILVTSSCVTGEDLVLSPKARLTFPLVFECKNTERMDVWGAIEQSESHVTVVPYEPVVAFKRNRTKLRCIVDLKFFLRLLARNERTA